jgi:NADH:ubiquinone oxidoreductase subunit E
VRGSRLLLKRFAEIIRSEGLEDEVALHGSFCMERCGETTNWRFDDENLASADLEAAEETLRARLAECKEKAARGH